jgi:hypothetical protein
MKRVVKKYNGNLSKFQQTSLADINEDYTYAYNLKEFKNGYEENTLPEKNNLYILTFNATLATDVYKWLGMNEGGPQFHIYSESFDQARNAIEHIIGYGIDVFEFKTVKEALKWMLALM